MKLRRLLPFVALLISISILNGCGGGGSSKSGSGAGSGSSGGTGGNSAPPIKILAVSPSHSPVAPYARGVSVLGENFTASSSVLFDGQPVSATSAYANSLTFSPADAVFRSPGVHTIQVTDASNSKSNTMSFTVYSPGHGPLLFATTPSEPKIGGTAIADMDGDGFTDLVGTVLRYDGSGTLLIAIDYGQSSGVLRDPIATNIVVQPSTLQQVIPGDFNKDGRMDIAIIYTSNYEIYRAGGDGRFTLAGSGSLIGANWGRGVAGDFNGDGKLDLAVDTGSMPPVQVLFGSGSGTFTAPTLFGTSANKAARIVAADMNNDGKTDLVFYTWGSLSWADGGMHALLFHADGTATDNLLSSVPCPCSTFAVADFNADGFLDIFLTNEAGAGQAFLGKGDGVTFNAVAQGVQANDGFLSVPPMEVGDFDHDGHLDIATRTVTSGPDFISLLWGDGYGGFTLQYITSDQTGKLGVGDVNGDGLADLFQWGLFGYPSVVLGRTNRNFPTAKPFVLPSYGYISSGSLTSGSKEIMVSGWGDCSSTISGPDTVPGVIYGIQPNNAPALKTLVPGCPALLADLDGDGISEMIGWNTSHSSLQIFKGDGSGSYSSVASEVFISGNQTIPDIVVRDMDKDGHLDIVLSGSVLYGKGGLQFDPVVTTASLEHHFAVGDFDGDGVQDIFIPQGILFGIGGRQFTNPTGSVPTCWSSYSDRTAVADINHDGKDDIVCNASGAEYSVNFGMGRQGLVFDQPLPLVSPFPGGVAIGDFNKDGLLDIAVGTLGPDNIVLFTNNGVGGFDVSEFVVGLNPMQIVTGDFNNDGGLDLAFINYGFAYKTPVAAALLHK